MKIRSGTYEYHGYRIKNCGSHQPDHCVWWEATDKDGACFHGKTLRAVMSMIDDSSWKEEVGRLKSRISELESALLPVMECSDELDIDSACAFAEHCISGDRCTCYGGKRCWVKFLHAVREAQRIMQEGEEK